MKLAALMLALIATTPARASDRPVILDFTSAHCGPCRQMRPEIEVLVRKGYPIQAIDVDKDRSTAERYDVTGVPTFIVVDAKGRSLARVEGYRPAAEIATLYRKAKEKLGPATPAVEDAPPAAAAEEVASAEEDAPPAATPEDAPESGKAPKPWQTVVRIKVFAKNAVGFGSGTIIHSTPDEAIILTCAHIFHLEDGPQAPPSKFPRKIAIDLFDGNLSGPRGQTVHPTETLVGQAIDYDFTRDVGLIRIKPGRRLPSSPVVPAGWKPKVGMPLTTVGCSQGQDATAWSTKVVDPNPSGERPEGHPYYEGTLCVNAPKQGRSGGGLYTVDGYVAGVCDFADYQRNRGYYAAPSSIHRILAKNGLQSLYTPGVDRPNTGPAGTLMASNGRAGARTRNEPETLRFQSPDRPEAKGKTITMPKPEILGIREPVATNTEDIPAAEKPRRAWNAPSKPAKRPEMLAADMQMDPSVADEPAADPLPDAPPAPAPRMASSGKWHAVKQAPVARRTEQIDDK